LLCAAICLGLGSGSVSPRAVDPALLLLLLVPLPPPPRKGWIFMAFCAFCVGGLWILGVLCAWDYLHSG
jgi:DNA-binding transcriptional LysR family regulator